MPCRSAPAILWNWKAPKTTSSCARREDRDACTKRTACGFSIRERLCPRRLRIRLCAACGRNATAATSEGSRGEVLFRYLRPDRRGTGAARAPPAQRGGLSEGG